MPQIAYMAPGNDVVIATYDPQGNHVGKTLIMCKDYDAACELMNTLERCTSMEVKYV